MDISIQDPTNRGNKVHVDEDGSLHVVSQGWPSVERTPQIFPYRQQLTLNGVVGASSDLRVNGSVTNQRFSPPHTPIEEDIYITTLSFVIADPSPALNQFGAKTTLTTGCLLQYVSGTRTVVLHPNLKSNWDFIRLCYGQPAFSSGTGNNAFQAANVSGTSEGYIPVLDLTKVSPPWGLRLTRLTEENISLIIKDDLSATGTRYVTQFDCIAYGFSRI